MRIDVYGVGFCVHAPSWFRPGETSNPVDGNRQNIHHNGTCRSQSRPTGGLQKKTRCPLHLRAPMSSRQSHTEETAIERKSRSFSISSELWLKYCTLLPTRVVWRRWIEKPKIKKNQESILRSQMGDWIGKWVSEWKKEGGEGGREERRGEGRRASVNE